MAVTPASKHSHPTLQSSMGDIGDEAS